MKRSSIKVTRRTVMARKGEGYAAYSVTLDPKMVAELEEYHPELGRSEIVRKAMLMLLEEDRAGSIEAIEKRIKELNDEFDRRSEIAHGGGISEERKDELIKENTRTWQEIRALYKKRDEKKEEFKEKWRKAHPEEVAKEEAAKKAKEREERRQWLEATIPAGEADIKKLREELEQLPDTEENAEKREKLEDGISVRESLIESWKRQLKQLGG